MNVMMITSLNTYTTNMKMQMKWQQKKTSSDFTADGAMTIEEHLRKEAQDAMAPKSKVSLSQIQTKLMYGKKLSSEEMDYLRENNPELYKKAQSIEMEREAYERELKQCKTKEEVQRVKMVHTTAALAQVNNIESDASIPKGAKQGLIMEQLFKLNAMGDVERKFVQSGEYGQLPTEQEQKQAQEELKEAQEAEQGIEDKTDDTPQEVAEDATTEEKVADTTNNDMFATEEVEYPVPTDHRKTGEYTETFQKTEKAKIVENTYSRNVRKVKAAASQTQTRMTRAKAEATPEALKVKRAKAQAAYTNIPTMEGTTGNILDIKK